MPPKTDTRRVFRLTGGSNRSFLQGLITNDVEKVDSGLVYAAILTPQGKFIIDFFLFADGPDVLLDVVGDQADMLVQRLNMYKLRADVQIAETDLHVHQGLDETPTDGFTDPRHPELGWRAYRSTPSVAVDLTAQKVALQVPTSGIELTADSFILEMGFERLNGVDFRKGCYVGQEVTARMKHKTELRKGLAQVAITGPADPGTEITADGKPAGVLHSRAGDTALAYLRFDRATGPMQAGEAVVTWTPPTNERSE